MTRKIEKLSTFFLLFSADAVVQGCRVTTTDWRDLSPRRQRASISIAINQRVITSGIKNINSNLSCTVAFMHTYRIWPCIVSYPMYDAYPDKKRTFCRYRRLCNIINLANLLQLMQRQPEEEQIWCRLLDREDLWRLQQIKPTSIADYARDVYYVANRRFSNWIT